MKIKRSDYIKAVAESGNYTQKSVKEMLDVMEKVAYSSACDNEVTIFNGLTLYSKVMPSRTGRNPQNGESIVIPEKRVPKVKFGKTCKDSVAL